mgnify:CR=1 FL=1
MNNRVYYGQYSLKHWLNLIMKKNIILPEYQRLFVWKEEDVKKLISTFKNKQFVPPITIGAFQLEANINKNLILDGQQRLTSVLLAYLGLFPDKSTFEAAKALQMVNENDDLEHPEDVDQLDSTLEWTFEALTNRGNTKDSIINSLTPGNYKPVDFDISEQFLTSTFLGFSFLVPQTTNQREQQKYYSSVFRNINAQGQTLLPQESRRSLYFLDQALEKFFDPDFAKQIVVKNSSIETKADFVRFLAILSQYASEESVATLARGFKSKMEKFYEEYIYSVVGENDSTRFKDFLVIFPDKDFQPRFNTLNLQIDALEIPREYTSIIDMDVFLMGLIYITLFESKTIVVDQKDELRRELQETVGTFKNDNGHKRAPGALKYLKERVDTSINIYKKYVNV